MTLKKYQINLFEPHISIILDALAKNHEPRLIDFIVTQVQLQKKNEELTYLQKSYEDLHDDFEQQQATH